MKQQLLSALVIAMVATAAVAPLVGAQDRTIGEKVDDATITASVKTKLVSERAKNMVAVNVDTQNSVVHLQGTVPTLEDRFQAERLARATKGVVDVKNDLKLETAAASPKTR
jgi:osmotically-inducible protein OsmY